MKKIMKAALLALALVMLAACGSASTIGSSAKEDALAFDEVLMDKMNASLDLVETLDTAVAKVSDGSDPAALDELAGEILALQTSLDEIEAETQAATLYVGAVRAYAANARVVVESVAAYLDSGDAADFEKFEHYTGMYADLLDNVTEKRTAFLAEEGLTK